MRDNVLLTSSVQLRAAWEFAGGPFTGEIEVSKTHAVNISMIPTCIISNLQQALFCSCSWNLSRAS